MSTLNKEIKTCSPKEWRWICDIFDNTVWHFENCPHCQKNNEYPCSNRPQKPEVSAHEYMTLFFNWLKAEYGKDSTDYIQKLKDSADCVSYEEESG